MLTYGGFLDPIVARARSLVNPEIEGATKQATNRIKQIDKEIKRLLKTQPYRNLPDTDKKKLVDNFMDILEGEDPNLLREIPESLKKLYVEAKENIDGLSKKILNSAAFKALPEVIQWLDSNGHSDTEIRNKVDTMLNFEKDLKKKSQEELK